MPTLNTKLAPLKASLTAALIHSLSALDNRKTIVVKLISLLLRLGAGPAARSTLLAARSEVTKKRVRMIRFEGAVEQYINDLAVVVFTGIKHTADWFLASFRENDMASGTFRAYTSTDIWALRSADIAFIDWAKFQIQDFATMYRKQVYTSDVDPKTVEGALAITYAQSKKVWCNYYRIVTILSWRCSYWKSSGSTSVSSSRSFLLRSRRGPLALAQFPHALARKQHFPHQRLPHLPHPSVRAPPPRHHARGRPIQTISRYPRTWNLRVRVHPPALRSTYCLTRVGRHRSLDGLHQDTIR